MGIVLYDPTVARALAPRTSVNDGGVNFREISPMLAAVDPLQAMKLVNASGDQEQERQRKGQILKTIAVEPVELRRQFHHTFGIWPIDVEDLMW